MPIDVPINDIGLTAVSSYSSDIHSQHLRQQLEAAGIRYETVDLPWIVGMAGAAFLLGYTSPQDGQPVTVLVVPSQPQMDSFGEDYYYFQGLPVSQAAAGDTAERWTHFYDRCLQLGADAGKTWLPVSRPLTRVDVAPGTVVIEAINGVRHRVAEIDNEIVLLVPVDNPLPVPRGNATGRRPAHRHVDNLRDSHRLLDEDLAGLDTATYAYRLGLGNDKIQWVPYQAA